MIPARAHAQRDWRYLSVYCGSWFYRWGLGVLGSYDSERRATVSVAVMVGPFYVGLEVGR